jgi:hypothetical protein
MTRRVVACVQCFFVLLAISTLHSQNAPQPDFSAVSPYFARIDAGKDPDLRLEIKADGFQVKVMSESPVTSAEERRLMQVSRQRKEVPELRFTRAGMMIETPVGKETWLDVPANEKTRSTARPMRRTLTAIASYPSGSWPAFASLLFQHGLSSFSVSEEKNVRFAFMHFGHKGPKQVQAGPVQLVLSSEFYQTMRTVTRFEYDPGKRGFVLIVHDPHWSTSGCWDLMLGLQALFEANPHLNADFLVEGAYPKLSDDRTLEARRISDAPLQRALSGVATAARPRLVNSMLSKYMIDTETAFRLLNPNRVGAFAIDSNEYLQKSQQQNLEEGSEEKERKALQAVLAALGQIQPQVSGGTQIVEQATETAFVVLLMQNADARDISDVELEELYSSIAEGLSTLRDVGAELAKTDSSLNSHVDVLKGAVAFYQQEVEIYKYARLRNHVMATFMTAAAETHRDRLPIAFIGNYHTQGIVAELKKAEIGYLVIEPQERGIEDQLAQEKVYHDLITNPSAFMRRVSQTTKNRAWWTEDQVKDYHGPYLRNHELEWTQERSALTQVKSDPNSHIREDRLEWIFNGNDSVKFASGSGGALPPKPPVKGAFAFFDSDGKDSRLALLEPDSFRWDGDDRYAALRKIYLGAVPNDYARGLVFDVRRQYQDPTTGRTFLLYRENGQNRTWIVERPGRDASDLLAVAALRKRNAADDSLHVHAIVSDLLKGETLPNGSDNGEVAMPN